MRTKNIHIIQPGYGERIKLAVALTDMNKSAFCRKYGFSYSTLRAWISEGYTVSDNHLARFINALEQENIECSTLWVLTGKGNPAKRLQNQDRLFKTQLIDLNISLEQQGITDPQLQAEVQLYAMHAKPSPQKFQVFRVGDQGMEPYFSRDDLLGCYFVFKRDLESLYGKVCVIEVEVGKFTIRKLVPEEDHYLLVPTHKEIDVLKVATFTRAGLIHWYRRV